MSKVKRKESLRYNSEGELVNYGFLELAYVYDKPVMMKREVILVMGMQRVNEKPPYHFYTRFYLRVTKGVNQYSVYVVRGHDLDEVGRNIARKGYTVEIVNEGATAVVKKWIGWDVIFDNYIISKPKLEKVAYKTRRTSKLKKVWLVIKRLFTPGD